MLTDDANAIDEALEFRPDIQWHFLNRTRSRGSEGGWEQQIPSGSPKSEVVTILATLKLIQLCDTIVYGESGFANLLVNEMKKPSLRKVRVDKGAKDKWSAWSAKSRDSEQKLLQLLQDRRQNKPGLHFECDFS